MQQKNFHDEIFNANKGQRKIPNKCQTPTIHINLKKTPLEYNKTLFHVYTNFIKG
jgi:hypothetical protein